MIGLPPASLHKNKLSNNKIIFFEFLNDPHYNTHKFEEKIKSSSNDAGSYFFFPGSSESGRELGCVWVSTKKIFLKKARS